MVGIALVQRDLSATRERLREWFAQRTGDTVEVSELRAANRASGWSSESLVFTVTAGGADTDYVIRIPPAGGGIFPEYDLQAQARTQEVLHAHGVATPSPLRYEPDPAWIGSRFLVMPRIVGHTPSDTSYATRGWLHNAGVQVQRRAHDSFVDTLARLHRVPVAEAPWLTRPEGTGIDAELAWWREYVRWGTDGAVPDLMVEAFDWLVRHRPDSVPEPSICWGDARLSNAIFDDSGELVGALDWEQACICPAECDIAWWLATRRQMLEVSGLDLDPELPGFDSRERFLRRYSELLGRELQDLEWYEVFAMVRMGCCILRTQVLLRAIGQTEHFLTRAPILPAWTIETVSG
ncbi:putative aminoglycoside phosphotransferase [Mycolicibacterium phlei]|jgi:aminoglycoside phosphotransferase (APT) family kinase protein|uniref:Aminoglycoside phosphotransferase n=1 Tax=Mycolicibacterium phlei DSM 43239 = CCUG 21000 TaxID=1226750 RepID=A0A5N5VDD9_MYCPH|nr:phosphotransferase family protein [Mycolicibacterium phlei]VEG11257.1 putative aminoglycoside phosphotransferase [Mycobacteroides chelonae]AMO63160.1 Putative aminoglycoside phosphotransferase [Mycolicibacterium phlei]EID16217.1 putative aminoglycoside phosphotransferase [Mycolicibacterium phlei RIVM601174]KAB7759971.1 aminoglycoside phosphotransferase [Mycolicibacterium phlei DSM 43239 = CCUG 21000]KXW64340.1 aminoglycoside phosphotransferase [Mycolicibacterium phlei DSM 43072]